VRHLKTASMAAASLTGGSPLFALDYLLRLLRVGLLLALWRMILGPRGGASGMTLDAVLTYTLISAAFADVLAVRTELRNALWDGSIAMKCLQPVALWAQFAADSAGRWAFTLAFFSLPLLLCAPLLGVDPRPASAEAGLLFAVSVGLTLAIGLAMEFLWAALAVRLAAGIWMVDQLRNAVATLLSGALIPLALLPWGLGHVFQWLPFASMASTPLRLYTGTGDASLLALQAGWAVALGLWARWAWGANRERMVSYGG
jgi:ABC-2 type transport system permease protein